MKCDSCSADVSLDSTQCEFCGTYVRRDVEAPASTSAASRSEIFARIKDSPQFQDAVLGQSLDTPPVPASMFMQTGFLVIFCCGAGFVTIMFATLAGAMWILPLGMLLIGLFGLYKSSSTAYTYATASAIAIPAIVAAKRVEMRGKNGTLAHYYATFEYENGERDEFPIWEQELFGKLAEEDAGVLIRRSKVAAGFRRVAM
ncbi:DUF2500 family protein [Blastopirellula retiformator]|uniref:Uncharacterized protein n=1 Tax=Blastopirellula retiformator TaxID=2527970 RepID=A0A5C5VN71_9BACT|nr:DUF2500 family protein [Blastopirellula retiformator]TWT39341.1 hypothetical protein Enr8_10400 [Blastopirellula retiformator]